MNSAEKLTPTISEPLTWAEICERHPNQELCLVEVDYTHPNELVIRSARVIGHGETTQEAVDQALLVRDQFEMVTFHSTRPRMFIQPPRLQPSIDDETLHIFYGGPRIVLDDETREIVFARPQAILDDKK